MDISVIVGSLREGSLNRKLFNSYRAMAGDEFNFKELDISDFPLYNQDLEDTDFPEAVENVADRIRESDGVLIFSPEYNYSIPGHLKNAIDWISRVEDQPFATKPLSVLGASPSSNGTARMQYHFRQVGVTLDMRILNKPEVFVSRANEKFNEQGDLTDETTQKILKKHCKKFKEFLLSMKGSAYEQSNSTIQSSDAKWTEGEHRP